MTGVLIHFSNLCKNANETSICFSVTSNAKTKFKSVFQSDARTKISFSHGKRKIKFISVFQSDAKTKNKKQNSNLFFNIMRKRKM